MTQYKNDAFDHVEYLLNNAAAADVHLLQIRATPDTLFVAQRLEQIDGSDTFGLLRVDLHDTHDNYENVTEYASLDELKRAFAAAQ